MRLFVHSYSLLSFGVTFFLLIGLGMGTSVLSQPQEETKEYIIGEGDVLSISVLLHPELTTTVTVLRDGTIVVPGAGRIRVEGLTVEQAQERIRQQFINNQILRDPRVNVIVTQPRALTLTVLGAVGNPGVVVWKKGFRISDVLAQVGGLKTTGPLDLLRVHIERNRQLIPVDIRAVMAGNVEANVAVQPGDTIYFDEIMKNQVSIHGAVQSPGLYELHPNQGLLDLLAMAKGPTPDAALTHCILLKANGQQVIVDLYRVITPQTDQVELPKVTLDNGDILIIPPKTRQIMVLGAVSRPGMMSMPEARPLKALEALAQAGGAAGGADLRKVVVVRQHNGQTFNLQLNLENALKKGDSSQDATLQPGDVLFVPPRRERGGQILNYLNVGISLLNLITILQR